MVSKSTISAGRSVRSDMATLLARARAVEQHAPAATVVPEQSPPHARRDGRVRLELATERARKDHRRRIRGVLIAPREILEVRLQQVEARARRKSEQDA